jgi:hypothetical protein
LHRSVAEKEESASVLPKYEVSNVWEREKKGLLSNENAAKKDLTFDGVA